MNISDNSIDEVFDERASQSGSRTAIREIDRDWSYAELLACSKKISHTLAFLGVSKGQRIGLMLPNSGSFLAAFFGIARVRGVIVPLNIRYRVQELIYYLKDTSASVLVVASEVVRRAQEALRQLEAQPALLVMTPDGQCRIVQECGLDRAADYNDDEAPLLQQYTSGSTGRPKRVVRSHKKLLCELERLAEAFHLGPSDRFLGAAPFSHVNGLVRTMMASMFVGGTLYPVPEFRRREILDLITHEKITYFGGVPYMYILLADTPLRGKVDLSSLRVVFSSSAPLLVEDNRRFAEKYGLFVRQLYGSTETGTISVNLHPDIGGCLESVGLPLRDITVEIVDEAGRLLPYGEEGDVAISSPAAITAYDGNPEATSANFRGGFYLPGDLGRKDGQGFLTLTGRRRFLINRGGFKVNPHEVEQAICSHPKVRDVVVLGTPTRHGDEAVRCVIVTVEPCTEEEIIQHCQERIADFKIPSFVEFRNELPKTETGKIIRDRL